MLRGLCMSLYLSFVIPVVVGSLSLSLAVSLSLFRSLSLSLFRSLALSLSLSLFLFGPTWASLAMCLTVLHLTLFPFPC